MKQISTVILSVFCLIVFSAGNAFAKAERQKKVEKTVDAKCETCAGEKASQDAVAAFQGSKAWNKLGGSLQQAWLDAMAKGDTERRLDCFVRVRAPADRGDESFLFSHGYIVKIFSGSIATGYMKAEDLQDVTELPFVDSVKLSKPPEGK